MQPQKNPRENAVLMLACLIFGVAMAGSFLLRFGSSDTAVEAVTFSEPGAARFAEPEPPLPSKRDSAFDAGTWALVANYSAPQRVDVFLECSGPVSLERFEEPPNLSDGSESGYPWRQFNDYNTDGLRLDRSHREGNRTTAFYTNPEGEILRIVQLVAVGRSWAISYVMTCDEQLPNATTTTTTTTTPEIVNGRPVPEVTELEVNEAILELFDWDLRFERVDRPDADVPVGFVIETNPSPGTRVSAESTVTIVVSTGPDPSLAAEEEDQ